MTIAADVDLGQLGDGDDRDDGVKGDAEVGVIFFVSNNISSYLLGRHADLWGLEANFAVNSHVSVCWFLVKTDELDLLGFHFIAQWMRIIIISSGTS